MKIIVIFLLFFICENIFSKMTHDNHKGWNPNSERGKERFKSVPMSKLIEEEQEEQRPAKRNKIYFPSDWDISSKVPFMYYHQLLDYPKRSLKSKEMNHSLTYEQIDSYLDSIEIPQYPYYLRNIYNFIDANPNNRDFITFLHIPKTAGQNFHAIFTFLFTANNFITKLKNGIVTFNQKVQEQNNPKSGLFPLMTPICRQYNFCKMLQLQKKPQMIPPRLDYTFASTKFVNRIKGDTALTRKYLNIWDYTVTHFDISLSYVLSSRRPVFITFLRKPIDRFYSYFNFLQTQSYGLKHCLKLYQNDQLQQHLATLKERRKKDKREREREQQRSLLDDEDSDSDSDSDSEDKIAERIKEELTRQQEKYSKCNFNTANFITTNEITTLKQLDQLLQNKLKIWKNHKQLTLSIMPILNYNFENFLYDLEEIDQNNYMTKAYSGTSYFSYFGHQKKKAGKLSLKQQYTLAKKALRRFVFIGLTELFQESVQIFYKTFNLPYNKKVATMLLDRQTNKNQHKVRGNNTMDLLISQYNAYDERLYDFVYEKIYQKRKQQILNVDFDDPKQHLFLILLMLKY